MNIFATYSDPVLSANFLDDKRMVKMILESFQLLSTAVHTQDETKWENWMTTPTHKNHPCAIWVRESSVNFKWLVEHALALSSNYTKRYGKVHKYHSKIIAISLRSYLFPDTDLTPFPNCTTYEDKDIHWCYRQYLRDKWAVAKNFPKRMGENIAYEIF